MPGNFSRAKQVMSSFSCWSFLRLAEFGEGSPGVAKVQVKEASKQKQKPNTIEAVVF